jgi:hypothetical protein
LGRAAARNIDDIGYALLVSASGVGPTMNEDAAALFATTHISSNYNSASTVLGDAGMTAAKLLMRKTKGIQTEDSTSAGADDAPFLNLFPRFALVPAALESTILKLVNSSEIMVSTAGDTDQTLTSFTKNIHQNTVVPIVEPRLDGATNGTTAWYLIADPKVQENFVIVHLAGQQNPTVERKDPVNELGIGWWMFHDAGVAAIDFRGLVRSKGA